MEETQIAQAAPIAQGKKGSSTLSRIIKYMGVRLVTLFLTVVVGIFLTVLIANMGRYVDDILRGEIRENVSQMANTNPALRTLPSDEKLRWMEEQIRLQETSGHRSIRKSLEVLIECPSCRTEYVIQPRLELIEEEELGDEEETIAEEFEERNL